MDIVLILTVYCCAMLSLFVSRKCKEDEFECTHPEDRCIPYEDSCNGWIDCMRDASDESLEECGNQWSRRVPEGMYVTTWDVTSDQWIL